jgi:hypothetical protein
MFMGGMLSKCADFALFHPISGNNNNKNNN